MLKATVIFLGVIFLSTVDAKSQEVVIIDFPVGVGGSVSAEFFKPYYPQLQELADILDKFSSSRAIVTGSADGGRYRSDNDAKNTGLALGRAHALRNLLVDEFKIDSSRIIIQSIDVRAMGGSYRYASVRIAWELTEIEARIDTIAQRMPVETRITELTEVSNFMPQDMGLRFGAGFSSSPFGVIPFVSGAVSLRKNVFVELIAGHTFWNNTFRYNDVNLDTRRRFVGGQMIVYPFKTTPVGFVAGWIHIEEISQDFFQYVKMSEGLTLGARVTPYDYLSITGTYFPSRRRVAGSRIAESEYDQFLLSMNFHFDFGGEDE